MDKEAELVFNDGFDCGKAFAYGMTSGTMYLLAGGEPPPVVPIADEPKMQFFVAAWEHCAQRHLERQPRSARPQGEVEAIQRLIMEVETVLLGLYDAMGARRLGDALANLKEQTGLGAR